MSCGKLSEHAIDVISGWVKGSRGVSQMNKLSRKAEIPSPLESSTHPRLIPDRWRNDPTFFTSLRFNPLPTNYSSWVARRPLFSILLKNFSPFTSLFLFCFVLRALRGGLKTKKHSNQQQKSFACSFPKVSTSFSLLTACKSWSEAFVSLIASERVAPSDCCVIAANPSFLFTSLTINTNCCNSLLNNEKSIEKLQAKRTRVVFL